MFITLISIFGFSLVAAIAVAWAGRRQAAGSGVVSGLSLLILLVLPLLTLLPGWAVLPTDHRITPSATLPLLAPLLPAGILIGLLHLLRSSLKLRRWIRSSTLLESRTMPNGRGVEIRSLAGLGSPCAAGIMHPVILVPLHWPTISAPQRDMILAHEMAHHQRLDPLWRLLASLACAIHWFNPLVWWVARRHALHAEFACDAAVLATGVPADRYAHLLCDLARSHPSPLAAAMSGSALGKRVKSLQLRKGKPSPLVLGMAFGILIVTGLACGLSRPIHPIPDSEIHLRLSASPFPGDR